MSDFILNSQCLTQAGGFQLLSLTQLFQYPSAYAMLRCWESRVNKTGCIVLTI